MARTSLTKMLLNAAKARVTAFTVSELLRENPENPRYIDLILTNKPRSFIKTCVIETGLSDYHKLVTPVMIMHFPKSKPSIITYRS